MLTHSPKPPPPPSFTAPQAEASQLSQSTVSVDSTATKKTRTCRNCQQPFQPIGGGGGTWYCQKPCQPPTTRRNSINNMETSPSAPATPIPSQSTNNTKRLHEALTPDADNNPLDKCSRMEEDDDMSTVSRKQLVTQVQALQKEISRVKRELSKTKEELSTAKDVVVNYMGKFQEKEKDLETANATISTLKEENDFVKLQLANKVIKNLRQQPVTTYAAAAAKPKPMPATLVVTLEPSTQAPGLSHIEKLLDSRRNGPVVQNVRHENDKMFIKFGSSEEMEKAKALCRKPEAKKVFTSVEAVPRLYPVLAHNVDQNKFATGDALMEDINKEVGNKAIHGHVKKVILFKKNPNSVFNTAKLLIDSRQIRDNLITRGRLYTSKSDSFRVDPVDPNREVTRCFKCQRYGHRASACQSKQIRCGKCAGSHGTKECNNPNNRSCVNCGENHQSGSLSCRVQRAEVERYKSIFC